MNRAKLCLPFCLQRWLLPWLQILLVMLLALPAYGNPKESCEQRTVCNNDVLFAFSFENGLCKGPAEIRDHRNRVQAGCEKATGCAQKLCNWCAERGYRFDGARCRPAAGVPLPGPKTCNLSAAASCEQECTVDRCADGRLDPRCKQELAHCREACNRTSACPSTSRCSRDNSPGICLCGAGLTDCGNADCRNLPSDAGNCGACGHICPLGQGCCSGKCVDLNTETNCGKCGTVCESPAGTCCGGKCVNTRSDNQNCGRCGLACRGNRTCDQGGCGCISPLLSCNASEPCVNMSNDNSNCGGCGRKCSPERACQRGDCICRGGLTDCGACTDTFKDPKNCGACGNACASGTACVHGQCQMLSAELVLANGVTPSPIQAREEQAVTLSWQVCNVGRAAAPAFSNRVIVRMFGGAEISRDTMRSPSLPPGGCANESKAFPGGKTGLKHGDYFVEITMDVDGEVTEANENNTVQVSFHINAPDLPRP